MLVKKMAVIISTILLLLTGCATQNFEKMNSFSAEVNSDSILPMLTKEDVVKRTEKEISMHSMSTLQQLLIKASEDRKELSFNENYSDFLLFSVPYGENLYSLIYKVLNDPDSNIYSINFSKNMLYKNTKKAILNIKYKNENNLFLDNVRAFRKKKIYIKNQNLVKIFTGLGFELIDKTTKNIKLSFLNNKKYSIVDVINHIVIVAKKQNINLYVRYLPSTKEFIIRDSKPYSIEFVDFDFRDILYRNENNDFDFGNFILKSNYRKRRITYLGSAEIGIYLALRKFSENRYKDFYFGICSAISIKSRAGSCKIVKAGIHKLNRINVILLSIKNIRKFLIIDNETKKSYVVSTNKNYFVVDNKFLVVY